MLHDSPMSKLGSSRGAIHIDLSPLAYDTCDCQGLWNKVLDYAPRVRMA